MFVFAVRSLCFSETRTDAGRTELGTNEGTRLAAGRRQTQWSNSPQWSRGQVQPRLETSEWPLLKAKAEVMNLLQPMNRFIFCPWITHRLLMLATFQALARFSLSDDIFRGKTKKKGESHALLNIFDYLSNYTRCMFRFFFYLLHCTFKTAFVIKPSMCGSIQGKTHHTRVFLKPTHCPVWSTTISRNWISVSGIDTVASGTSNGLLNNKSMFMDWPKWPAIKKQGERGCVCLRPY